MTTGGLAAVVYGHPRLTLDVDLVIRLAPPDVATFARLWPSGQFYCPPEVVIAKERGRGEHGHFNVIHHETAMRADVYLAGADALQRWALQHRVVRIVEGEAVQFAPIEYVIVYKLLFFHAGGSDRHLRDIARMMEVSGSDVDRPATRPVDLGVPTRRGVGQGSWPRRSRVRRNSGLGRKSASRTIWIDTHAPCGREANSFGEPG
jgi:hypothetical protein